MKFSKTRNSLQGPLNSLEAEIAITALHATGSYSVLRELNLDSDTRITLKSASGTQIGICLDTETTGLNHVEDKIIELGIIAFEFNPITADIIRITGRYNGFEDPGYSLPNEIIEITGITDDMVRGQSLDDEQVNQIASQATVVIAHNAGFDRKFVEARFPLFKTLSWACSVNQINRQAERISTRVLE